MRTNFPVKTGEKSQPRTVSAQIPPGSEPENVKYPKVIRNKKTKAEATIYGKKPAYPFYRVAWRVSGQRRMKSVRTYSEALTTAEEVVADLGKGSQKTALTVGQATDATAALQRADLWLSLSKTCAEGICLRQIEADAVLAAMCPCFVNLGFLPAAPGRTTRALQYRRNSLSGEQ